MELSRSLSQQGLERAMQAPGRIILRSVQAGVYIALAALFALTAGLGAKDTLGYGPAQLITGVAFSLGLILVVIGGAELFTGANLTVAYACMSGKITPGRLWRQWSLCYLGNLLGSLLVVLFVIGGRLWQQADGALAAKAISIAAAKAGLPFWPALIRGIGCNVLVCLAVLCAASAKDIAGKIIAIVPPIAAFVAMGLEHSVANMFYLPLGLWLQTMGGGAPQAHLNLSLACLNLAAVTLGNILGGAGFVAGTYWLLYGERAARPPLSAKIAKSQGEG